MERWRLLRTFDASPELAMGLDEVLLERPGARPTLRLYSWRPDTLSLGYFQRFADVPAASLAPRVVRRITGGGAIHHDAGELTFSIGAPANHPLYRGPIAQSYARVHAPVIEALAAVGVPAALRGDTRPSSDRPGTGMCFHASTPLDVVWHARKGVGSAQRRRGGRVLHHGSIKVACSAHEEGVAEAPGVTVDQVAAALIEALGRTFGLELVAEEPTAGELEQALVRGARYADQDFVHRR